MIVYVDDIILTGNDKNRVCEIKSKLKKKFKMKDLGEPQNFLGMTIERDRENRIMKIHQERYTEQILEKFNMQDCNPQSTPMVTKQVSRREMKNKIETQDLENKEPRNIPYREAIGSLLYLAGATRPDISFAVSYLSRRQQNPTLDDWTEVKRIFRYLRGTTEIGLIYKGKIEVLDAMTDASFRDCSGSTSTSGYIIRLFGDTIAWRSHKQSQIALSTCHAEFLAMSESCSEIILLDKALRDMLGRTFYPVLIRCDNRSAVDNVQKEGNHKLKGFDDNLETIKANLEEREKTATKKSMAETHGDYIKECVKQKRVKIEWIQTKFNLADIMTKPLALETHRDLRLSLMNPRL